jgi:hypothetical protein
VLPPPGADGFVAIAPTFALAYVPAPVGAAVLARATVATHVGDGSRGNGSSVIIRLGVLEDFSAQPVSLTTPLRGLVQVAAAPDYTLVDAAPAGRAGRALSVAALSGAAAAADFYAFASTTPLVPLNVSTQYVAFVDARGAACAATTLRVSLYEDDDFNSHARLINYTSSGGAAGVWSHLSLSFESPAWPAYADVRMQVIGDACDESSLFQHFFFGRAIDAPSHA